MYREGVYNRQYGTEESDDGYRMKRSHRGGEGDVAFDPRAVDVETGRRGSVVTDASAQYNYADIQQQLNEIEAEDQKRLRDEPHRPEYQSQSTSSHPQQDRIHTSPERRQDYSDDYTSDSSSRVSSSAGSGPRKNPSKSTKPPSRSSTTSTLQEGYREARHLAGGIIHHPSESTEHYSILRHSHGLVFYQGTATSVAISIFADTPLPPLRTIWLKPKSSSGSGKNRATFRQQADDLLNVTPETEVKVSQLNSSDERAWQRDITEFERRTRRGPRSKHILRETEVVRIPAEAGDGYFQLVLCVGEKEEKLCVSPSFRILSVSTQMGGISGAHWSTLPFEIGAMALSMQAWNKVGAATILPVKLAAKNKASPYIPSQAGGMSKHAGKARMAGKMAYGASGAGNRVAAEIAAFNSTYDDEREGPFTPAFKIDDDYESGPKHPYPIRFMARCNIGSDIESDYHILPMTKLVNVPDIATYKLCGYYFGWCTIVSEPLEEHVGRKKKPHWFQAVIVVSPVDMDKLDRVTMSRATRKDVHIQILAESHYQPLHNAEVNVEVFGCLRPWDQELESMLATDMRLGEEVAFETANINEMSDINLTQTILDVPAWGPDAVSQKEESAEPKPKAHGMERVKQEYTEKRLAVQKKIDQVPLHKVGVRMPVDKMRDKTVVLNGYYIER